MTITTASITCLTCGKVDASEGPWNDTVVYCDVCIARGRHLKEHNARPVELIVQDALTLSREYGTMQANAKHRGETFPKAHGRTVELRFALNDMNEFLMRTLSPTLHLLYISMMNGAESAARVQWEWVYDVTDKASYDEYTRFSGYAQNEFFRAFYREHATD